AALEVDRPVPREGPHGRLGGAVDAERLEALRSGDRGVEDDRAAGLEQGQPLLHGEEQALHVGAEDLVVVRLGDGAEGQHLAPARIGEEHVDAPLLLLDGGVEAIEVGELRHVALHGHRAVADLLHRLIELALAPACDEDVGTFVRESLGGGEADAAVASRDHRDFSLELLCHGGALPWMGDVWSDEHVSGPSSHRYDGQAEERDSTGPDAAARLPSASGAATAGRPYSVSER